MNCKYSPIQIGLNVYHIVFMLLYTKTDLCDQKLLLTHLYPHDK